MTPRSFFVEHSRSCPGAGPVQASRGAQLPKRILEAKVTFLHANGVPSSYDLISPLPSDPLIVNKTDKVACQQTVLPSLCDPSLRRFILGCSRETKLNVVKLEGIDLSCWSP
jgi:hypothetical protein